MADQDLGLSVVIPLRNEEELLSQLADRLTGTLDDLDEEWEVILVDDGSSDATYGLAVELHTATRGSRSCGFHEASAIRSRSPQASISPAAARS